VYGSRTAKSGDRRGGRNAIDLGKGRAGLAPTGMVGHLFDGVRSTRPLIPWFVIGQRKYAISSILRQRQQKWKTLPLGQAAPDRGQAAPVQRRSLDRRVWLAPRRRLALDAHPPPVLSAGSSGAAAFSRVPVGCLSMPAIVRLPYRPIPIEHRPEARHISAEIPQQHRKIRR
jgi:hypothetical protein